MGAYLTTRFCALLPASRRHAVQVACLKVRGPMGSTQTRAVRRRVYSVLQLKSMSITTRMAVRARLHGFGCAADLHDCLRAVLGAIGAVLRRLCEREVARHR